MASGRTACASERGLFSLPADSDARPTPRDRVSAYLLSLAPWLILYLSVQAIGPPTRPLFVDLSLEKSWPVVEWTVALYVSDYVLVPLVPLLAPSRRVLRVFIITGVLATVLVGVLWLTIPVVAVPRQFVPETFWGRQLARERSVSAHVAAFPSFHVLWALIAADALRLRSPAWGAVGWSWAALVTLSCVTTGQHALLDLVAAALLFLPVRHYGALLSARLASGRRRPALRIHKWYLDCTTSTGDAVIIYSGRASLGWLQVPYFELLSCGPGRLDQRVKRFSQDGRVGLEGKAVVLNASRLGISGRWVPTTGAIEALLLDDPSGTIWWRCHQPGGRAKARLPDGRDLDGDGYAEELVMTCPPWALPFLELRWGRFVGGNRSVVWIDWRGKLERRWVFVNGVPVEARVGADSIEWPGGRLEIDAGRPVREATIGRTIAGPLSFCLPRRIARAIESKWLSRGRLLAEGGDSTEGSVIHEVVRWA